MMEDEAAILVVDDDDDIRDTMIEALEDAGFRAVGASDGGAALDWLRTAAAKTAVIFLDLMMPKMSGFEFRRVQLESSSLAEIPVVILSADAAAEAKAAELGAAGCLAKPLKLQMLLGVAEQFLRK